MLKLLQPYIDRRNNKQMYLTLSEGNLVQTYSDKFFNTLVEHYMVSRNKNLLIDKYDDKLTRILETGIYRLKSKQAVIEFVLFDILEYLDGKNLVTFTKSEIQESIRQALKLNEFIRLFEFSLDRMMVTAYKRINKQVEFSSELLVKYDLQRDFDRDAKHVELVIPEVIELCNQSNLFNYPIVVLGTKIFRDKESKVAIIENAQIGSSLLLNILKKDKIVPVRICNTNIGFQFKTENLIVNKLNLTMDLMKSTDKYLTLRVM